MKLLFDNASQLVTCAGAPRARRGEEARQMEVLTDAALVTKGERILAVGPRDALRAAHPDAQPIDCGGRVLMPGLVDSHTHGIFGKPRHEEQELRAAGVGYMEIAKRGGGIHSSVRDLRARSEDELLALALPRLRRLMAHGTTTLEVKSGYGLTLEDELKSLRVIRRLQRALPIRLVPTFLGAHEIPLEYRAAPRTRDEYIALLVDEMLPRVAAEGLAVFGLQLKLHADELETAGAAELAAEIGAVSADHLAAVSDLGIKALAASKTVATLLPGTMLFLGRPRQAPARALLDAGAAVALASDFNPGTSPTVNFPLVLTLAVSQLHLSVSEAILAATVNGAAAVGLAADTGQLSAGYSADLALFDIEDVRELPYWYGDHRCHATWVRGAPALLTS
ncbi:MAG: imidazolonepropionase [Gemmatimonadetes bacterium]|nr:imidazolonepropionase [Gemmatimonadota bacterium]